MRCALLLLSIGCTTNVYVVLPDAAGPGDGATSNVDVGATSVDAPIDARVIDAATVPADAGGDRAAATADAAPACTLAPQSGCPAGLTCRHADSNPGGFPHVGRPYTGPVHCERGGSQGENAFPSRPCAVDDVDVCAGGLFCTGGVGCRRYCDPLNVVCAPGQYCNTELNGVPYCSD